jgi:sirohydrochlorin cobaltochelatase
MPDRIILAYDSSLPAELAASCRDLSASFATMLGESVLLAGVEAEALEDLRLSLSKAGTASLERIESKIMPAPDPMSSAPFLYRDDGRPDWASMWGSFCELALYGGPPHRGADNPVVAIDGNANGNAGSDAIIAEIRRGIWETTGLFSEPVPPSWLAITCHSRMMAAWMAAAIILENVDARCEDEVLYVPARPDFDLKDEVKSVITVVAKVNHYWQAHVTEQQSAPTNA